MASHSSGIMPYRWNGRQLEVFLVHPGGPFWANRDRASWSIPKGEFAPEAEESLLAARRELREETGLDVGGSPFFLGRVKQPGGKIIHAWAVEADLDPESVESNTFQMEWPRGSDKLRTFPEVDRAAWFEESTAADKMHKGQVPLLDRLRRYLEENPLS